MPASVTIEWEWFFSNPVGGGTLGDGNATAFFTSDVTNFTSNFKWYANPNGMNYANDTVGDQIRIFGTEVGTTQYVPVTPFIENQVYLTKVVVTPTLVEFFIDGALIDSRVHSAFAARTNFGIVGHGSTDRSANYYLKTLKVYDPIVQTAAAQIDLSAEVAITGDLIVNNNIMPDADSLRDIGATANKFNKLYSNEVYTQFLNNENTRTKELYAFSDLGYNLGRPTFRYDTLYCDSVRCTKLPLAVETLDLFPLSTNENDLGTTLKRYRDIYLTGTVRCDLIDSVKIRKTYAQGHISENTQIQDVGTAGAWYPIYVTGITSVQTDPNFSFATVLVPPGIGVFSSVRFLHNAPAIPAMLYKVSWNVTWNPDTEALFNIALFLNGETNINVSALGLVDSSMVSGVFKKNCDHSVSGSCILTLQQNDDLYLKIKSNGNVNGVFRSIQLSVVQI